MTEPLDPAGLRDLYNKLVAGRRAWLDYHLSANGPTAFGARLLIALAACETRQPGVGHRFIEELADIRYVSFADNPAAWNAGFEQLIQKLAEILTCRILCAMGWPDGTRISIEPKNRRTGARPEFAVITPKRTWLFEVKCPAFIKHQAARRTNPAQLPIRSFLRELPMLRATDVTLPRDNVLKDFLASADRKFFDFDDRPTTGILVVVWDAHIYEAVSVLAHEEAGLLTEKSWLQEDGSRVPFSAVDGVILINRLDELKAGAQEGFDCLMTDPFALGQKGDLASIWCPNLGAGPLDPMIAEAFDAAPVGETAALASDYAKTDFIMWLPTSYGVHLLRERQRRMSALLGAASTLAIAAAVSGHAQPHSKAC